MSVFAGFLDHVGCLVHPSARPSELDSARHRTFLASRFGLFFAVVCAWVLSLAAGHIPGRWEAMAVAWLCVPFVAAAHVSRTGRLYEAEAACLAAWWGLAITTTLGGGTSLFGGCILMLIAPLEAMFSGQRRLINASVVAASLGVMVLGLANGLHLLPATPGGPAVGDATVAVPALLFVVVLARCSLAFQERRERLAAFGDERYRALSETIGDLVLRYDRIGGVIMASREAEQLFGITPRDLLGRGFFERVHVADRPSFLKLVGEAGETGQSVSARLRFRTARLAPAAEAEAQAADPVFAWIEIRARRFDPRPGQPATRDEAPGPDSVVIALVRDISGQIEHEQAIEGAKLEAERLSLWKDGFLANVSHELRTPLNAIIGFSEILASEDLSPRDLAKQRDYARIITASGQHLLSVVNSLLDISKIEAGCFDIDPEVFSVAAMVKSCCDMVGLKAEQAGITMNRAVAPHLGDIVADKRACKQILINLLSNALKFTPSGGSMTISAKPDGDAVVLTVVDTGVGIAPRDLKRLGDAFFQAKSGLDRPFEGTGLGLSVVRGLVGLHGGTIAIASAPDEGTLVTVRLPLDCRGAVSRGAAAKIETIPRPARGLAALRLPAFPKVHKVA